MADLTSPLVILIAMMGVMSLTPLLLFPHLPIQRTGVNLTREETATLKQIAAGDRGRRPPPVYGGPPLYNRGWIVPDTLAIFPKGLRAKFGLGKVGRRRFVPWSEISGIYPIDHARDLSSTFKVVGGSLGGKQLQIETRDGHVFVAGPPLNPLETIVPILQAAMGPAWRATYQGDVMLQRKLEGGDYYVHQAIRRARRPPTPDLARGEISFAEPAQARPTAVARVVQAGLDSKGELLIEENPEPVAKRKRSMQVGGKALVASAILLVLLLGAVIAPFPEIARHPLAWLLAIAGAAILACGLAIMHGSRAVAPIRVFENGIELASPLMSKPSFVSWGEMLLIFEMGEGPSRGYVINVKQGSYPFSLPGGLDGLPGIIERVRPRIGKDDYIVRFEPKGAEAPAGRRREFSLYGVAGGATYLMTYGVGVLMGAGLAAEKAAYAGFVVAPTLGLLILAATVAHVAADKKRAPKGPLLRVPLAASALMVVAALVAASLAAAVPTPDPNSFAPPAPPDIALSFDPRPATSALAPGAYKDERLVVNGSIWIVQGETLSLLNTTLIMNLAANRQFGIFIERGATLLMENSSIAPYLVGYNYSFEILGSARILNSTVSATWGNPRQVDDDGGLEIYSDDVVIEHSTIVGGRTNAIMVRDASPRILNSTFVAPGDDCLELTNSRAEVRGNTFSSCPWGIVVNSGSSLIADNTFLRNRYGIVVYYGSPVIVNNSFEASRVYALRYNADHSAPTLAGNSFSNNRADLYVYHSSFDFLPAIAVLDVLLFACCAAGYGWLWRRARQTSKLPTGELPPELR